MKNTEIVKINGRNYSVILIPGDRRTIALRMVSAGKLEVRFPRIIGRRRVIEYLYEKNSWIEKKHKFFTAGEAIGAGKGIFEGRLLYYSGEQHKVKYGGDRIEISCGYIMIPVGNNTADLEEWYRTMTEKAVNEFIEEQKDNIPDCTIKVKKQKTMWGSCNSKRRIYINLKLSMCPTEVIEYVIWHEICHLTHMNHSKDFYLLLSQKCPGYQIQKVWLKKHSLLLRV